MLILICFPLVWNNKATMKIGYFLYIFRPIWFDEKMVFFSQFAITNIILTKWISLGYETGAEMSRHLGANAQCLNPQLTRLHSQVNFKTRKKVDFDFVYNMVGRQGNSKSYIIENKGYNYKNDSAAEQDYWIFWAGFWSKRKKIMKSLPLRIVMIWVQFRTFLCLSDWKT